MISRVVDTSADAMSEDGVIVLEAMKRKRLCDNWEGLENDRGREDTKFANGDTRNTWQWPSGIYQERSGEGVDLPSLTINKTRVHNDMIINDLSKHPYGVKVRPAGNLGSYRAAEIMQRLIMRTQNISRAQTHYRKVCTDQVDGGIGYILIETRYVSERSFDQEIFLVSARDPTAVLLDPWIREPDGSDANFGFVYERLQRDIFNERYPGWKSKIGHGMPFGSDLGEWLTEDEIILAKYFRRNPFDETLISYIDGSGHPRAMFAREIEKESGTGIYQKLRADIDGGIVDGRIRKAQGSRVEWFLIAGDTIIERGDWAGKYIPICRCVGHEIVVSNTLDRKGHTRPLVDAQRMLNYAASMDVLMTALQPRATWLAPSRATEGQELWRRQNISNVPVLLWNDIDDSAPAGLQQIAPPQRIEPVQMSPAYRTAMANAERQMMMISGQYQSQLGEREPLTAASGVAIGERQKQSETATFHFAEHLADMKRNIGMQLLDLYGKIYDTKRVLHDVGDDGEKIWITIDPNQQEALLLKQDLQNDAAAAEMIFAEGNVTFNPARGEYQCVSDPGPDYATQRQEAWDAYAVMLQQNVQMTAIAGDLLFRYADFPGADKIAERIQREIAATKPYLLDKGTPPPQVAALQAQLQKQMALNAELMQKLALKQLSLKGKEELRDIEAANAETRRLQVAVEALSRIALTPAQQQEMQADIAARSLDKTLDAIISENMSNLGQQ